MADKKPSDAVQTCSVAKCKRHVFDRDLCLDHFRKSVAPIYKAIADGKQEVKPE